MNQKLLLNTALLALLILGIFLVNQKNTAPEIQRLTSLDLESIQTINITRNQKTSGPGKSISFFKNKTAIWYMKSPYTLKAHQFRINTLLSLTQTPVDKIYTSRDLNLADFALDNPRASIKFNNTTIYYGNVNPLNNQRYLLVNNNLVMLTDTSYPLASAQAASFVDLSLVPDNFNIIKIKTPEADVLLDNDGQWLSSGKKPLNTHQIQNLLQSWKSTQAFAVHRYLPRKQLGEITLYSEARSITYIISETDPWLILALPDIGIEYHLDKSLKDKLYGYFAKESSDA